MQELTAVELGGVVGGQPSDTCSIKNNMDVPIALFSESAKPQRSVLEPGKTGTVAKGPFAVLPQAPKTGSLASECEQGSKLGVSRATSDLGWNRPALRRE